MPDDVVPVSEVTGIPIDQAIVGTSTNGSYADIATVADVVTDETVAARTDAIVAPASKRSVELLAPEGGTTELYAAGVSISESTCRPCIGQEHTPAPDVTSLRAFNRNFRRRSDQANDSVYLASPAVVAASAVAGEIVDPWDGKLTPPSVTLPNYGTCRHNEIVDPDPTVTVERGETVGTVQPGDHIVPGDAKVISLVRPTPVPIIRSSGLMSRFRRKCERS
jgi:aconitate hydratase